MQVGLLIDTSNMYVGPSSSAQSNSGRSRCSAVEHWGDQMSDDGSNQSDIPSTPFYPTGDPASPAHCTQFPAHLAGAAEGSGSDLLGASGGAGTQIFVWGKQHSQSWTQAALSNKIRPRRCWHQAPRREVQLVPGVWSPPHSGSSAPCECRRCPEPRDCHTHYLPGRILWKSQFEAFSSEHCKDT